MLEVKIAQRGHSGTARSVIQAIEELVDCTPEKDAEIVHVAIGPETGYGGESRGKADTVDLYEETLTDGSKVYNIEVY